MKNLIAILIALVATVLFAEDKVVEASGMGSTYRAAVNEALITALEKTEGVTVSASMRSQMESVEASVSSTDGDSDRVAVNDSITKGLEKVANGKILGYDVVSEDFDPTTKKYTVQLSVRMPGAYVVGLDPSNRRRMAVVPFRVATGDSISWFGKAESSAAWANALADKMNERLTQTRKFTMVDRKFDSEVNAELARLTRANASKADAERLNQKLGTDYLIVGEVKFSPVVAPGVNPLTGQALPMTSQRFAEVSYRVLLAPTGQLKWTDTVVVDALDYPAGDIQTCVSMTAEAVAAQAMDGIMGNILPLEIVGKTPSGLLLIGEGGKSLDVGERFTVFARGEVATDTRTGEELDEIEDAVGTVEIVRVTSKMSYAKVIEGDAKLMVIGSRLRRPEVVKIPEAVTPPVTTTIQSNGAGGIVAPF